MNYLKTVNYLLNININNLKAKEEFKSDLEAKLNMRNKNGFYINHLFLTTSQKVVSNQ